jgi:hypothetical protein
MVTFAVGAGFQVTTHSSPNPNLPASSWANLAAGLHGVGHLRVEERPMPEPGPFVVGLG